MPWRRMTGVRSPGRLAPNPMTGTPREVSMISGKSAGKVVPTRSVAAEIPDSEIQRAAATVAASHRERRVATVVLIVRTSPCP